MLDNYPYAGVKIRYLLYNWAAEGARNHAVGHKGEGSGGAISNLQSEALDWVDIT